MRGATDEFFLAISWHKHRAQQKSGEWWIKHFARNRD